MNDNFLAWDYIKCRIRTESITYSINKSKRSKQNIDSLNKNLTELENSICSNPAPCLFEEHALIKKQLEDAYAEKSYGSFIRSRCKHLEEFERPTKYFFDLEKFNHKVKHIRMLQHGGKRFTTPADILQVQHDYFSNIYTDKNAENNDMDIEKYLDGINIPKISEQSKTLCDSVITLQEVQKAINSLTNNKTPGPDGIPSEFYKTFWTELGNELFNTFIKSFEKCELTKSQKQGIINLIPKKGKYITDLKSWRPLSILNTDYKILAKILSNRLKVALKDIINPDQAGYMENRFCGENTRLIADVIDFCQNKKASCVILLADFEKAFDTVKWNFLKKVLNYYGFGYNFKRWITILYNDSESCVANNGYTSSFFKLSRGIRQGCPISALLFLLVVEINAIVLRKTDRVSGLKVGQTEIKLCQLADDMTLFLTSVESVKIAIELFEVFRFKVE